MKNDTSKKGIIWVAVFMFLFLLTQDFLFVQWTPNAGLLGLPHWLWWFVGIHFLFIFVFQIFIKKHWQE